MKQLSMDKLQALAKKNSTKAFQATLQRQHEAYQKQLDKDLHSAIAQGDYDRFVRILDAGANPKSRVNGWGTVDRADYCLRKTCGAGERPTYERIISLLIERGATDTRECTGQKLHQAIDRVDVDEVKWILSNRVDPDTIVDEWTALDRVNYLIGMEKGKDRISLQSAKERNLEDIKGLLLQYGAKKDVGGDPGAIQKKLDNRLERAERTRVEKLLIDLHYLIPREGTTKIEPLVEEIVRGNGDLDRLVNDWTALGLSTYVMLPEITNMLRKHGARKVAYPEHIATRLARQGRD